VLSFVTGYSIGLKSESQEARQYYKHIISILMIV